MQNDEQHQERIALRAIVNGDSQRRVIDLYTTPGAPKVVRLIAAPGTGKTTTGCNLIKEMFLDAENPLYPNFLFLTFTRRTRIDLVRKIYELRGYRFQHKEYVFSRIRNFHSLAYGLVFWNQVIEKQDEDKIFDEFLGQIHIPARSNNGNGDFEKTRIRKLAWKMTHKFMAEAYTQEEKEAELQRLRGNPRNIPALQLIQKYQKWLKERYKNDKAVTYDQAICLAIDKVRAGRPCHRIDLESIDLIIVDEFQDSNPAQVKMVESLMQRTKKDVRVLMMGDFDQNIYLWRGAKFRVIQDFIERYPWQQMFLQQSYRLSESIKNISQQLIVSNPNYQQFRRRYYQNYNLRALNTTRDHPLQVLEFQSEYSEVRWVVDTIYKHIQNGFEAKDITILCRQFQYSYFYKKFKIEIKRKYQETNQQVLFDYQNSGDSLGTEEAKYILALLKYFYQINHLHKPNADDKDIKRILQLNSVGDADDVRNKMIENKRIDQRHKNYPRRQRNHQRRQASWRQFFIDFQRIEAIIFNRRPISENLQEIATIIQNATWLSKSFNPAIINEFIAAMQQVAESIDREEYNNEPTLSVIKKLVQDSNYNSFLTNIEEEDLREEHEEEHPQRISMRRRRDLALMRELEVRAKRNRMCVQTMHNAKGLEYPIVFLCALDYGYVQSDYEETQWRLIRATDAEINRMQQEQRDEIVEKQSEELRLIYTAITRTSGYVYACASKEDNYNSRILPRLPEHKVFAKLKELCGVTEPIPYNEELDNPTKETIIRELERQNNRRRENRGRGNRGRGNRGRENNGGQP